jgi:hypothetical protein
MIELQSRSSTLHIAVSGARNGDEQQHDSRHGVEREHPARK